MNKLAGQNLSERNPSRVVEVLFHSHPPVTKRITAAESETIKKWILWGANWPDGVTLIARKKEGASKGAGVEEASLPGDSALGSAHHTDRLCAGGPKPATCGKLHV